jgi:hypothetical protein
MDYSQLSDFEINKCVAEIIYRGFDINHPRELAVIQAPDNEADVVISTGSSREWRNYCHNPADAWPIIVGKKLSLINADDKWLCVPEDEQINGVTGDAVHMIYSWYCVEHENPLRAAMIVFLMTQATNHA